MVQIYTISFFFFLFFDEKKLYKAQPQQSKHSNEDWKQLLHRDKTP